MYTTLLSSYVGKYYYIGSTQQNLVLLGPIQEIQKAQNKLLTSVTESQRKILSAIEELKDMISDQAKAAFQIKGSHHEVRFEGY